MIKYRLRCTDGHVFDHWFASMAAYEDQVGDGAVHCPDCDSAQVEKTLMAPNLGGAPQADPAPASTPCGMPACAGGGCAFGSS